MHYEILAENAAGGEFPRYYAERFYEARQYAVELAEELSDGGRTGRVTVRNAHDEAVISVRVRGPLALIFEHRSGDLPVAYWNGAEFDYFHASRTYQDSPDRSFVHGPCEYCATLAWGRGCPKRIMHAGAMVGDTFVLGA